MDSMKNQEELTEAYNQFLSTDADIEKYIKIVSKKEQMVIVAFCIGMPILIPFILYRYLKNN